MDGKFQPTGQTELFFEFLAEQTENVIKLSLHGDHLLAHVKGDFGAFEIDTHLFDQQAGDPNAVDLIEGINFLASSDDRLDDLFLLQALDELDVDTANFRHLGNA
jgi:hypothetical protein